MQDFDAPAGSSSGALSVLVLGGYGLIGSAVMRRLAAAGHQVTGVGRSLAEAQKTEFQGWHIFDVGEQTVEGWSSILVGVDVVVNASGALQDGPRDNLKAIHETALERLGAAAAYGTARIIQISAAGVASDASTEFFRSKARGEAALEGSGAKFVILRPTLVLSPAAYGGTALLRAAAALPFESKVLTDAMVQSVHIDDLTQAVLDAVDGRFSSGTTVDVTGADVRSLPDLIRRTRMWLGYPKAKHVVPVPRFALRTICRMADLAGRFGWRSPLRSTAVQALQDGVRGDPSALADAGGTPCRDLEHIFATLPSTVQERWFARAFLALPIAIMTLSLFWLASGTIGLIQTGKAMSVLTERDIGAGFAAIAVIGGGIADIVLGTAVLFRALASRACLGMIALSFAYLAAGTLFTPDIWADPLGPFVKVIPGMVLAWLTIGYLGDR